jgi:regulator of replication initiation timing
MFSCFTKVFQTHNIVVDPEFQAALHESSNLIKEQQKMIGTFIEKMGGLKENIAGLKTEMENLRRENAEVRERMTDLSAKISTVIVEVFEEVEQEKKANSEIRNSPPTIQTPIEESPLDMIRVQAHPSPKVVMEEEESKEESKGESKGERKEDYQEIPQEVAEEELVAEAAEPVAPEPTVTKKGRGGSRSKKK